MALFEPFTDHVVRWEFLCEHICSTCVTTYGESADPCIISNNDLGWLKNLSCVFYNTTCAQVSESYCGVWRVRDSTCRLFPASAWYGDQLAVKLVVAHSNMYKERSPHCTCSKVCAFDSHELFSSLHQIVRVCSKESFPAQLT